MLTRLKVFAAKTEATVGTAESLTGSEGVFNVFDLKMLPTIDFMERQGQGGFSRIAGTLGQYSATATFRTQLCGGASDPTWMSVLLPACGFKGTSHVYTGVAEQPGSNVKTITIGGYYNGLKKLMRGCVGNCVFNFVAGQVCYIDWTFVGAWEDPSDVAILSPSYPSETPLRYAGATFTIGSYAFKASKFTLDLGNEMFVRDDGASAGGIHSCLITGRKPKGSFDPETTLVATKALDSIWKARTTQALVLNLGTTNNGVNFAAPALQITNIQESDRNGLLIDDVSFDLVRSSTDGDELTITNSV